MGRLEDKVSIWVLFKLKQAAREWLRVAVCAAWPSLAMSGTVETWWGKLESLILQKQGEEEGWTVAEEGLEAMGNFRVKSPTRIRTNGHGSIERVGRFGQGSIWEV